MQFSARVNANSHFFRIIILTSVLFLICPLISILVAYWVLLRENKERCIWLFAVLMACYISFVNISKSISSDPDLRLYRPHRGQKLAESLHRMYDLYSGLSVCYGVWIKWKRPRVVFSYF